MKKETIKRGVWSMTRTIYEDDDDCTEMGRYLTTRELLEKMRAEALDVLAAAGYPTEPGRYFHSGPKQYERTQSGRSIEWPLFTEIEPLTIEDFAARVISVIDRVLTALDEGADGQTLAGLMLLLIDYYHPFRVERDGIGTAAEAGKRAERSINGAREKLNRRSELFKALVTKHKATYCQKHPNRAGNKSSIASGILADVKQDMRAAGYSDYKISPDSLRKLC